jgi:DNA-binding MarR family transcriptional regulator
MKLRSNDEPLVAGSFSFLVNKLAQIAGRGQAEVLAPLGIAPRESGILAALTEFGPMSQQRIGELLLVDRSTMVLSIDHLEELGFVERTVHPTDRRVFLVALTSRGKVATRDAKKRLEAFETQLLAPLSRPERAQFRAALGRLVAPTLHPDLTSGRQ